MIEKHCWNCHYESYAFICTGCEDYSLWRAKAPKNEELAILQKDYLKLKEEYDNLADRNCELSEENFKLKERLKEISKVVNDTWC